MGAAATAAGRADDEQPALLSIAEVRAAHESDRYRIARTRHQEILGRHYHLCNHVGYQSTALHMRPLMQEKLNCTLSRLDDLAAGYGEDQRRHQGHTEVFSELLAEAGPVRALCPLGDGSSVACASSGGPLWVYNWREGQEVSRMRCGAAGGAAGGRGSDAGAVLRLCVARQDGSLLASGDQRGHLILWDLCGPRVACEARLHQGAVTGLSWDPERDVLVTASEDTHLMIYDVTSQEVLDRAKPASLSCGDGIPSTALGLAGTGTSKMLLVGGADGKLRCWSRDGAGIRRLATLPCNQAQPSRVLMARDGWRAVVATSPADPVLCGGNPGYGGLLLFDIRKLRGGDHGSALVAEYRASPPEHQAALPGCIDLALCGGRGGEVAMCLSDGVVRGFDLDAAAGGQLQELTAPAADGESVEALEPSWNIQTAVDRDAFPHQPSYPCAIACINESFVATASTGPSLDIWKRTMDDEPWGHAEFIRPPQPKLVLRSRCSPMPCPSLTESDPTAPASHACSVGATLASVQAALERDRCRAGHAPGLAGGLCAA